MRDSSNKKPQHQNLVKLHMNSIDFPKSKGSHNSLNKYGKSPYLQKITQGFSLPKKNTNLSSSSRLREQSLKKNHPEIDQETADPDGSSLHQRSKSNMAHIEYRGSPKFKLPKIDVEHTRTDRKQKVSTSSFSATLDITNRKKKLLPLQTTFRRASIFKTKPGTNGKQTKINQDIAIIQNTLPHGVKLYCICDGHGLNGHLVSSFIKQHLIKNLTNSLKKHASQPDKIQEIFQAALAHTNQQLLNSDINTELSGSTVIAIFIHKEIIYSFNVGDSRAILATQNNDQWNVLPLSDDQKPSRQDQKKRILEFGGRIEAQKSERGENLGPERVWMKNIQMPGLAMTRSFGDKAGRKAGTNGDPELLTHKITQNDKFIVIASDGVWEYLQNEEVMNIVIPFFLKNDLDLAAQKVVRISSQIWHKLSYSRDDITLIIVSLHPPNSPEQQSKQLKNHEIVEIKKQ